MSEHTQPSRADDEPAESSEQTTRTEYVERSDVGVSPHSEAQTWNRYQGQDEVIAKAKGKTLEDAREDMEVLREYIHDLAEDARQIQPEEEDG